MFKHLKWRKLIPLVIVLGLSYVVVGTDLVGAAAQNELVEAMKAFAKGLVPMAANIFIGLIILCLAYAFYDPIKEGLNKLLALSKHADERGRMVVSRAFVLIYWLVAFFVGISFIAPDLLAKLALGIGVFGAALALAMQGVANDFIAGVLLNFRPKFCLGDEIELNGLAGVKGKVVDIGYVLTVMELSDGTYSVPNREVWGRAVKVTKTPDSGATVTTGGITCAEDARGPGVPAGGGKGTVTGGPADGEKK